MNIRLKNVFSMIGFLTLVFFVEWVGHWLTSTSVGGWYVELEKPIWNPPAWVFGPVWTLLYVTIAVSGWLVFTRVKAGPQRRGAFAIYWLQLLCNLSWSYFFFYLKSPLFAFIDIAILVALISWNIALFGKLCRPAAALLVPYLAWVLYATSLNAAIWSLNR